MKPAPKLLGIKIKCGSKVSWTLWVRTTSTPKITSHLPPGYTFFRRSAVTGLCRRKPVDKWAFPPAALAGHVWSQDLFTITWLVLRVQGDGSHLSTGPWNNLLPAPTPNRYGISLSREILKRIQMFARPISEHHKTKPITSIMMLTA